MTDTAACSESDVLARARSGEAPAFAVLVRSHQRVVYSLALRMLSDRHKAEDLAQEVFMQLHRNLASVVSEQHLLFWLRKVATNLAIDRLRQEPKHAMLPLEAGIGVANEVTLRDPLLERHLRELIAELPAQARAVVVLRYQEDLDPTDIAEMLDMSINTVKSHLKRSLASLRERLSDRLPT